MENDKSLVEKKEVQKAVGFGNNEMVSWHSMKEQAQMLVKSGFLPPVVNTPEKAIAIMMAGKEIGIGFMESLRSINVIQGKPTISPQLMLALANKTGQVEDVKISYSEAGCTVTVKRKGRSAHSYTFGKAEATAMGLIGKDNYKKQANTMYQWRAIAGNLRVTFPDVVLGFYTPEEMGAEVSVGENGEMVVEVLPEPKKLPPVVAMAKPVEQPKAVEPIKDRIEKAKAMFVKTYGVTAEEVRDYISGMSVETDEEVFTQLTVLWKEIKDLPENERKAAAESVFRPVAA